MKTDKLKITVGYIIICLIWGSTWLATRIGLESVPPIIAAGLRSLLSAVFLLPIMKFYGAGIQTDKASLKIYTLMCFFCYVFPFSLIYWGQKYVDSGLSSVLFTTFPFFIAIFSRIAIPSEKINGYTLTGMLAGFAGVIIIFSNDMMLKMNINVYGMAAIITSAMMQAALAVIIKKDGAHLNPVSMNFIPILFSGIILTTFGFLFEDKTKLIFDLKAIISTTYLALFGTVIAFTIYYWLLKKMNIVILSLNSFINPIIAVILGYIVLHEKLNNRTFVGSLLVLIGILFANFSGLKNYYVIKFRSS